MSQHDNSSWLFYPMMMINTKCRLFKRLQLSTFLYFFKGDFCGFFLYMYDIQHCFICRPSDFTVSEDAGIEPRTVATTALAVRRSKHSARSHPHSARSHPHSKYNRKNNKIMRVCTMTIQDLLPYLICAGADCAGQGADRLVEAGRGKGGTRLRVAHRARVKE